MSSTGVSSDYGVIVLGGGAPGEAVHGAREAAASAGAGRS
jgi:hypothetical protein